MNNVASSSESARIFDTGLRNLGDLKEEELTRFSLFMHSFFVAMENAFYQHRYGTLENELWERWRRQLEWYTQRAGVVAWWEFAQRNFSDKFRDFVYELTASEEGR